MNITYLIGNGFDVNIGLKSRYVDFYAYYSKNSSENELEIIKKFKREINSYIKEESKKDDSESYDWRDLEVALGQYTRELSEEAAEILYLDIIDNLKGYLTDEFKYFDESAFSKPEFMSHLFDPIANHFSRMKGQELRRFIASMSFPDYVNIINFNYTHSLERLTEFKGKQVSFGDNLFGRRVFLSSILHIHQTLDDEEILVGVNDKSQIINEAFRKNSHICNLFVKPETNTLLGTGINEDCEAIIANTDLFVLFGTSVGITDKKWWTAICRRLYNSNARMILFVHMVEKKPHLKLQYDILSKEAIKSFIKSAGGKEELVFDKIFPRCYVSFSDDMFKLSPSYENRIPIKVTYKIGKMDAVLKVLEKNLKYILLSVDAPDGLTGVKAERKWINEFFSSYNIDMQTLMEVEVDKIKVPFDKLSIHNKTTNKDIYFDISSFLGKNADYKLSGISEDLKVAAIKKLIAQ